MPASDAEIEDALAARYGATLLRFRFAQRTAFFGFIADLTRAFDGSAETNNLASGAPLRTATFSVDPVYLPSGFDPASDFVGVTAEVYAGGEWNEFPRGLFRLDVPEEELSPNATEAWTIQATDLTTLMQRARIAQPLTIPVGTNYITAVEDQVDAVGLAHNFPATALVLPVDRTHPPGTSRATIMNRLLRDINFFDAWPDLRGVFTSRERLSPSAEAPSAIYATTGAHAGMIRPPFRRSRDNTRFDNRIAMVIDDPNRAPGYALRVNDDPSSPISTVTIGETVTSPPLSGGGVASVAVADVIVDYELKDRASRALTGTLRTRYDPRRDAHEFYELTIESFEAATLWRVNSVRETFSIDDDMEHALGRAAAITTSFVITVGGTILTADESEIVTGGDTILLTLPDTETWIAAGAGSFDLVRQGIIDGLISAGTELHGWNNDVLPAIGVGDVARSSDTLVTITLPAVATYDISVPETVTPVIPDAAITSGGSSVSEPGFTIIPV